LLDCVVTDWTPVESGAVSAALLGKTQAETADYLLAKTGRRSYASGNRRFIVESALGHGA